MTKPKVLVLTNFNPQSEVALQQSIYFAIKIEAEIVLLHVIKNSKPLTKNNYSEVHDKLKKIIINYRENHNLVLTTCIKFGKVIPEILNVEKEIKPEFIFLGTETNSKSFRSTTIKIIDQVNCPVVVLSKRDMSRGLSSIVLPLDLNKETKQKIDITLKIAIIYNTLVHIISAIPTGDKKKTDYFKQKIKLAKEIFDNNKISCITELLFSKNNTEAMSNKINDYANKANAGVIIIMTRQENSIEKFFVGNMATKLIKKAEVPVLCISPKN